jgi:light-regulated signal transduction histidine kinase (bacteriophytochrome)
MPNLSGFETASLIYEREKLKHIPIIFITANTYGEANVFKGYRMGAVDYIYKPVNSELLRAKVAVFVELYRKNHRLMAQEQRLMSINKSLENEVVERKMSEEKIKDLNQQLLSNIARLESANNDLDRFAFMASHDLQEPLRKIRTFIDLLYVKNKHILDDYAQTQINRIQNAAERMQRLINDILAFSKISTQNESFISSDLNIVVKEVLEDMELVIRDKKAQVIVGNLPMLYVNPGLMRPLFYNLIDNALKYSKKDESPVIYIRTEDRPVISSNGNSEKQNKFCRILIEDNGIGFDQKYAEQIFDMFRRLHVKNIWVLFLLRARLIRDLLLSFHYQLRRRKWSLPRLIIKNDLILFIPPIT